MPETPEEIAKSSNGPKQTTWLMDPKRSPREILGFMAVYPRDSHLAYIAESALEVQISEQHLKAAEILEHYTRTLIRLQWATIGLTVALLVFTIVLAVRH
jgi:hypothetical protein